MTKNILMMKQEKGKGIIDIYGEVVPESWRFEGEMSATHFKDQLDRLSDVEEISVNLNSPGGSVYEGLAIYNMLKRHKARIVVNVDGLAASIASVIAMAGDVIRMPENSMLMIHNAMTMQMGNADDMRETAELLDKVSGSIMTTYLSKSNKINEATLKALMDAETWLTADEALHYGLVDEVTATRELVACASEKQLNVFNKTPERFMKMVETPEEADEESEETKIEEEIERRFSQLEGRIGAIEQKLEELTETEENEPGESEPQAKNGFSRFVF